MILLGASCVPPVVAGQGVAAPGVVPAREASAEAVPLPSAEAIAPGQAAEPFVVGKRSEHDRRRVAHLPDRRRLLRGALGILRRPARGRPGGAQPGAPSGFPEQRVRGRLPGLAAPHRLPVQLHLRRLARRPARSRRLGPGPQGRRRGAGRKRLRAGRPRHPLSRFLCPALVGGVADPGGDGGLAHLLPLARQLGRSQGLPPALSRGGSGGAARPGTDPHGLTLRRRRPRWRTSGRSGSPSAAVARRPASSPRPRTKRRPSGPSGAPPESGSTRGLPDFVAAPSRTG